MSSPAFLVCLCSVSTQVREQYAADGEGMLCQVEKGYQWPYDLSISLDLHSSAFSLKKKKNTHTEYIVCVFFSNGMIVIWPPLATTW